MCNRKYFLLGLVFSFFRISAQQLQTQDAVSVSLSGTDVACGESLLHNNPAHINRHRQSFLILNLSNRYMLPELSTSSLAGIWSREKDTFSGSVCYFGSRTLHEMLISLGCGRQIKHWLDAGIRMNYWRRDIEVYYVPQQILTAEAGIRVRLPQQFQIGIHLINPVGTGYPGTNEKPERGLRIGLGYEHGKDFYLGTQLTLIDFKKPTLSMGMGYCLVEGLVLRCGMKLGEYLSYSFGLGTSKGRVQFNLGASQHMILGISAACSFIYKIAGE